MANNLLYLYCSKCNNYLGLAKYYPSTGWYTPIHASLKVPSIAELKAGSIEWFCKFQDWLDKHSHNHKRDMDGNNYIELKYEEPR